MINTMLIVGMLFTMPERGPSECGRDIFDPLTSRNFPMNTCEKTFECSEKCWERHRGNGVPMDCIFRCEERYYRERVEGSYPPLSECDALGMRWVDLRGCLIAASGNWWTEWGECYMDMDSPKYWSYKHSKAIRKDWMEPERNCRAEYRQCIRPTKY